MADRFMQLNMLLQNLQSLSREELEHYVLHVASLSPGDSSSLQKLEDLCARGQSQLLTLSLLAKWRTMPAMQVTSKGQPALFTRHELADYFKVCKKTVENWISCGLETTDVMGVSRISWDAVEKFRRENPRKKFGWRSVRSNTKNNNFGKQQGEETDFNDGRVAA